MRLLSIVSMLTTGCAIGASQGQTTTCDVTGAATANSIRLSNEQCSIEFDAGTGALQGIGNVPLKDAVLKRAKAPGHPFRLHADFVGEYLLDTNPETAAKAHPAPGEVKLIGTCRGTTKDGQSLELTYKGGGFACVLSVVLQNKSGDSKWTLTVRNESPDARSVLVDFPRLDEVQPGAPDARLLTTVLNQAGCIAEAWSHGGGVYGNGGQWSMQWHSIFDPASQSALGLIVEDPQIVNKRLVLSKPSVAVRYFPPQKLEPGQALTLPPARLLVYQGDWKATAHAYTDWYSKAFIPAKPPQWFLEADANEGRHFKKAAPGGKPDSGGQFMLNSFRDLPAAHLRIPFDFLEYAFWSRGSMLHGVHTDGDNIIREDMGGPDAMRDGIAGLHRLGLHTTFYIEGYIVSMKSQLAAEGKAQRWSVMHRDGSINGPYTGQGFFHMCPGCVEWQDHLVSVVSRVLRETGADGVRLDSLGFYFLPCYNPEHRHTSPFGYNEWIKELLSKVAKAALAVNPNALLTTEAPVDFYGQWFHGALTQVYPRDIPPMRLAVRPYRPIVYAPGGPVWGSISGLAGGRSCWEADLESTEGNWMCARTPAHDAIVWGRVADADPPAGDPEIITRRYVGSRCEAVVAVRPACRERMWPAGTKLSDRRAPYELSIPVDSPAPPEIALCDIETLTWSTCQAKTRDGKMVIPANSNWLLVVIPQGSAQVINFDPLPETRPSAEITIRPQALTGPKHASPVDVWAPGLLVGPEGKDRAEVRTGDNVTIRVPADALPGWYQIRLRGQNVLGVKRLLHVTTGKPGNPG